MKYHLVWITKYRKPVLYGQEALRLRDFIRLICVELDVQIIKGFIRRNQVQLYVSVPSGLTLPKLMGWIKGKSAHYMFAEFRTMRQIFPGGHLWARKYYAKELSD